MTNLPRIIEAWFFAFMIATAVVLFYLTTGSILATALAGSCLITAWLLILNQINK